MATRRILKAIRQAKAGDALAQLALGRCYLEGGEGLGRNPATAYQWLAQAADQGLCEAIWLIGEKVPAAAVDRIQRAKTYYEKAQQAGSLTAGVVLAKWSINGLLGPITAEDEARQLQLLRQAAVAGNEHAQIAIGSLASDIETIDNDIKWLISAAERGDRDTIRRVHEHFWSLSGGELWHPGQVPGVSGHPRSAAQLGAARLALYWHERFWAAGERDMPPSEIRRRGSLLLINAQVSAGKWLQEAAEAGDPMAAYLLALMYMGPEYLNALPLTLVHPGAGPLKFPGRNYKLAAYWLEKASQGYLAEADYALWLLNGLRNYTCRNAGERAGRLTRAARMGHPDACWRKGCEALKQGDLLAAARWLDRAALLGNRQAQQTMAQLAPEMLEPDAQLLDASASLRRHDPALALRLELGAYFGLIEHEFLLIDPHRADSDEFLFVDVRAYYARAQPRLIKLSSLAQRSILRRAQLALHPAPDKQHEPYKNLKRKFRQKCQRLGIHLVPRPESRDSGAPPPLLQEVA